MADKQPKSTHAPEGESGGLSFTPTSRETVPTRELAVMGAPYNPRKISDPQLAALRGALTEFGVVQPIVVNRQTYRIVGGHQRVKAAEAEGIEELPVVWVDLDEVDERRLNLALNRISGEWDDEGLKEIVGDLKAGGSDFLSTGFEDDELSRIIDGLTGDEDKYTAKVEAPIYEPKEEQPPPIADLYDTGRSESLSKGIMGAHERGEIDAGTAEFLIAAAERHTVFRYDRIAEFYAHAEPEVQQLMEDSALVIVDFDKAIERGFVKLTKGFEEAFADEHA